MNFSDENIVFSSEDNAKLLVISVQYCVENYIAFNVQVKSGNFQGESNFCISKKEIISTLDVLSKMHSNLNGMCSIKDTDSDAYINIEVDNRGHCNVFGQIGGSHQDHLMRFKYCADQTLLYNLIKIFEKSLESCD
ncbi:hypothetical protein ACFLYH_03485 [Candidatus Dependentiae bacterium]